jgi:hypothetical protein
MPTLLTKTITIALTDEDYAACEKRARARDITPTEAAREVLSKALHAEPFDVVLLAELLTVRRLIINGPGALKVLDADKLRDARKMLGYDTEAA